MARTHFRMASRTAALIGRENVSSADGALIELVKNTYDADASICFLWLSPEDDVIYVYDNGEGMDERIIENAWMTIGTNNKQVNYRTPKGRTKSGEKGIGRFALDRLGALCVMFTQKNTDSSVLRWEIAWDDFDVDGMLLEDIGADLSRCDVSIDKIVPEQLKKCIESRAQEQGVPLRDLWSSGTILKIASLRDAWSPADCQRLFDALEILIPPREQADYSISYMLGSDCAYRTVEKNEISNFDYRLECSFDGSAFEVRLNRDEFIVERMPEDLFDRQEFSAFPYRKVDFEKGDFVFTRTIEEIVGTSDGHVCENVTAIGPFSFSFAFARLANTNEDERILFKKPIGRTRSQWLEVYGGVKIYRDNFWVRPYGERGSVHFDWLGLDARHAKNPQGVSDKRGGWTVHNRQCQGTLDISRVENSVIADKSSREGVVDNTSFKTLRNLLIGLISIMERDRAHIYEGFKKYYDSKSETEGSREKGREIAKKVLHQKNNPRNNSSVSEDDVLFMAEALADYERQTDDLMNELKLLRSLATNGLITSAITHDLKGKTKTLVVRADALLEYLHDNKLDIVEKGLIGIAKHDEFFRSWMATLLNQLKTDRRKRTKRRLGDVVTDAISSLEPVLTQKNVEIKLANQSEKAFRLFEADINSIIYNLIINSLEEFELEKVSNKCITVEIIDELDGVRIRYADSGNGLGSEYGKPEDILRFGVSSKKTPDGEQYGTGLGMYIVDSTVSEYAGRIEFVKFREAFELNLVFPCA